MKKSVLLISALSFLQFACTTVTTASDAKPVATTAMPANIVRDSYGMPTTAVSLDFKQTDSKEVLKMLFDDGETKYVFASNLVSRPITVNLQQVPWREALNQITASAGYDYAIKDDGTVHVKMAYQKRAKGQSRKKTKG